MFSAAVAAYQVAHEEALMSPQFTEAEQEFIRDDVRDAVIDALAMGFTDWVSVQRFGTLPDSELPMGCSDPVRLAPLELEF